jgi:TIR domain-containing protein
VRLFMSYRRTDDANFTGRFHDKLVGVFGETNVFRDIDSIPAGTRFQDVITDHLAGVDAVLAMIGPTWAARLDAPSDFVRMEIAEALKSGTPVIPVLIEDTPFPTRDALPDDLRPLLDHQTVRVRRDPDFHRDAARVVDGVREAVEAQRERAAKLRRREVEEADRKRAERELEQALAARRREIETELARVDARAAEERRVAEALDGERAQRLAELARLEEEMTQRRIADERARVAEIIESQALRERDAAAAELRAEQLRRELADLPATIPEPRPTPTAKVIDPEPAPTPAVKVIDPEPAPTAAVKVVEPEPVRTIPVVEAVMAEQELQPVEATSPVDDGEPLARRKRADLSRTEWIGVALLLVATVWAVWALFRRDVDGGNAFSLHWVYGALGVLLAAGLLLPLVAFRYRVSMAPVSAGASIGYLAFHGFPDSLWFWREWGDEKFPTYAVFIGVLLGAAWIAFRLGGHVQKVIIDHRPSRWLQIGSTLAIAVAMLLYFARLDELWDYTPRAILLYLIAAALMVALSTRRSLEATIVLAIVCAACAADFLAIAIDGPEVRGQAWNGLIFASIAAATAFWRCRRVVRAPSSV